MLSQIGRRKFFCQILMSTSSTWEESFYRRPPQVRNLFWNKGDDAWHPRFWLRSLPIKTPCAQQLSSPVVFLPIHSQPVQE